MCLKDIDCPLFHIGLLQPPLYAFQQLLKIFVVNQPARCDPMPLGKNCRQLV
jgi:hypothetical protein